MNWIFLIAGIIFTIGNIYVLYIKYKKRDHVGIVLSIIGTLASILLVISTIKQL